MKITETPTGYEYDTGWYKFTLPRMEFLLRDVKEIEVKIIRWCKTKKYSQGDSYSVRITKSGKWAVSYSNDYPMQHGAGKEFILTPEDFKEAMELPEEEYNRVMGYK